MPDKDKRLGVPVKKAALEHIDKLLASCNTFFVQNEYRLLQEAKARLERLNLEENEPCGRLHVQMQKFIQVVIEERYELMRSRIVFDEVQFELDGDGLQALEILSYVDTLEVIQKLQQEEVDLMEPVDRPIRR